MARIPYSVSRNYGVLSVYSKVFLSLFVKPRCTLFGFFSLLFSCRYIEYFGSSSKKIIWGELCLSVKGGQHGQSAIKVESERSQQGLGWTGP